MKEKNPIHSDTEPAAAALTVTVLSEPVDDEDTLCKPHLNNANYSDGWHPEYDKKPPLAKLSQREAGFVEGYADALEEMYKLLSSDYRCGKSYDPLTVSSNGKTMDSYAYELRHGGRQHPVSDFKSVEEICRVMWEETIETLKQNERMPGQTPTPIPDPDF